VVGAVGAVAEGIVAAVAVETGVAAVIVSSRSVVRRTCRDLRYLLDPGFS
jgi:hypothetical protein